MVKLDPIYYKGLEIQVLPNNEVEIRELTFDADILADLEHDGFAPSSPLEFNLYLNGIG